MPPSLREWVEAHRAEFSGELTFDEPLAPFTYYKIGGPADVLAVPKSLSDLQWLARLIKAVSPPTFILGAGSNLLVSDDGFRGLVIRALKLNNEIAFRDDRLTTGVSVLVSTLLRRASTEGWKGLEFLTGVPGSVGGVVTMNAGTHIGEAGGCLESVRVFDLLGAGELTTYAQDSLKYSYRKNSYLKPSEVIFSATWRVQKAEPSSVKTEIDALLQRRKNSQPIEYPSCGSVFKNPKAHGKHAWQVIDELGLRGYSQGDAQFSEKHSNFIINRGHARAADVRALIELAKSQASSKLGITLEEEVKFLGYSSK